MSMELCGNYGIAMKYDILKLSEVYLVSYMMFAKKEAKKNKTEMSLSVQSHC